jgi:hypothetical protein
MEGIFQCFSKLFFNSWGVININFILLFITLNLVVLLIMFSKLFIIYLERVKHRRF